MEHIAVGSASTSSMKSVMVKASINIDIFGAHSCRSASTSSMKFVMVEASINTDIFGAHSCRSASISSMKFVMVKLVLTLIFLERITVGQLRILQ